PTQSNEDLAGETPLRGIRPNVGFSPKTPQQAAGILMDPPVSVPIATSAKDAATDAAEPLEEPPGISFGKRGLTGVPKASFMPVIPKASSCSFVLPTIRKLASSSR